MGIHCTYRLGSLLLDMWNKIQFIIIFILFLTI